MKTKQLPVSRRSSADRPEPRFKAPVRQGSKLIAGYWYFWDGAAKRRVPLGVKEDQPTQAGRDLALVALAKKLEEAQAVKVELADPRLDYLCNRYLADVERRIGLGQCSEDHLKMSTLRLTDFCTGQASFGKKAKRLHNGFGALRVSELKRDHVKKWIEAHSAWTSPNTVVNALRMLQAALNLAKNDGLITGNPIAGFKAGVATTFRSLVWEPEEIDLFRSLAGKQQEVLAVFEAMLALGCRPSEICRVDCFSYEEVDGRGFWVLAPGQWKNGKKTGRERRIALTPEYQALTKGAIARGHKGPLFVRASGEPWSKAALQDAFRVIRKRCIKASPAFRKGLHLYDVRGNFITTAVDAGKPIKHVALQCGTSVDMIERCYYRKTKRGTELLFDVVTAVAEARKPSLSVAG